MAYKNAIDSVFTKKDIGCGDEEFSILDPVKF